MEEGHVSAAVRGDGSVMRGRTGRGIHGGRIGVAQDHIVGGETSPAAEEIDGTCYGYRIVEHSERIVADLVVFSGQSCADLGREAGTQRNDAVTGPYTVCQGPDVRHGARPVVRWCC